MRFSSTRISLVLGKWEKRDDAVGMKLSCFRRSQYSSSHQTRCFLLLSPRLAMLKEVDRQTKVGRLYVDDLPRPVFTCNFCCDFHCDFFLLIDANE